MGRLYIFYRWALNAYFYGGFYEKSKLFLAGMLALALVFGMTLASCTTVSSVGGTADSHGLFSSANAAATGSEVIASYGIILGLLDTGYEGYVSAVKEATSSGKIVSSVTTEYFGLYTKVTAYAK